MNIPHVDTHAIHNGAIIQSSEATVPVSSRAVQYGFSTFESLRVVEGVAIHLRDHLQRLQNSCAVIGLVHPFTEAEIAGWVAKLLAVDRIREATVRIQLYGGPKPELFILAQKLLSYPDSYYSEGVKAITYHGERLIPSSKTGNLLLNYLALEEAKRQDCFEALLVDRHGAVLEGTRSNFYAFANNTLYTAPDELVLQGITRDRVIAAAKKLGFTLTYEAILLEDLQAGRYTELFISATSMAAMPLSAVDSHLFPSTYQRTRAITELVRSWDSGEEV